MSLLIDKSTSSILRFPILKLPKKYFRKRKKLVDDVSFVSIRYYWSILCCVFSFLQPFLSNKKEIGVWFYQKFNVLIWTMQKNCRLSFIFKCCKNFIKSLNRELFELLKSSSVVCFRRFINVAVKIFRLRHVLQFFSI